MSTESLSVLLATYADDDPGKLERAIESVFTQTVEPNEVVVVADGPLSSGLETVLRELENRYYERLVRASLPTNQGLGAALRHGVSVCSHDLVARIDSDDVAVRTRFEEQLAFLSEHPGVDALGGYIAEFPPGSNEPETVREVPTTPEGVRKEARYRCPVNHPSVMFRRDAVLDVGNYRPLRSMQDYELWMRMLSEGYTITNISSVLVHCEGGAELLQRRGGLSYANLELRLMYRFFRMGMMPLSALLLNVGVRIPLRLAPRFIRGIVYRRILRSRGPVKHD